MDYTYKRHKKKKKLKIIYKIIIALISIILFIIFFLLCVVNPIVIKIVESKVKMDSTIAVNNAALEVFNYDLNYNDLINLERDSSGNITFLSINSIKINRLALETVKLSQLYINALTDKTVSVPLGAMSGLAFLSGTGPDINFKILPVGNVKANYKSTFTDAGINQTRHVIFIEITADIKVILPMKNEVIKNTIDIYVAESIIVGKIPDVFLNSNYGKLTLVP